MHADFGGMPPRRSESATEGALRGHRCSASQLRFVDESRAYDHLGIRWINFNCERGVETESVRGFGESCDDVGHDDVQLRLTLR